MTSARALIGFTPEGLAHLTRRVPCPRCYGERGWVEARPPFGTRDAWRHCTLCTDGTDGTDGTVTPDDLWVPGPGLTRVGCENSSCDGGCPSCGGLGNRQRPAPGPWKVGDTVAVVVERCEHIIANYDPSHVCATPRRQVIAATATVAETLPVVGDGDEGRPLPGDGDYLRLQPSGRLFIIANSRGSWDAAKRGDGEWSTEVAPGPFTWEPGQTALRLTDVTELTPPVTEMECPDHVEPFHHPVFDRLVYCQTCYGTAGRAPLSVVDGDEVTW